MSKCGFGPVILFLFISFFFYFLIFFLGFSLFSQGFRDFKGLVFSMKKRIKELGDDTILQFIRVTMVIGYSLGQGGTSIQRWI